MDMVKISAHTLFPGLMLVALPASGAHFADAADALARTWVGYLSLAVFCAALILVAVEEFTELRKSKPMVLAAGIIWGLIGWASSDLGNTHAAEAALRHNLLQYSELMLLMLVVMTYINALSERQVFAALRHWVCSRRLGYRQLFWTTGLMSFFLSPLLDNLSTALLMGTVVMTLGHGDRRFASLGLLNVVIAANAGGAFSPFGDITTLMVWQQEIDSTSGRVGFWSFFQLFLPALAAYLIPATLIQRAVPEGTPRAAEGAVSVRRGARRIVLLFLAAIATAVAFQSYLGLPAVIGMMTGLAYLQIFGFYLRKTHRPTEPGVPDEESLGVPVPAGDRRPFDVFVRIARSEWDTLLFLYGVALSVGGLGYLGYLTITSHVMYSHWGPTIANIAVGLTSSVLENIPTMYAVLAMAPQMSLEQWLLVTLTTGIGGSLLSIGSAAGVALMGQARGIYTFFSHLRWTPAILLGYFGAIWLHLQLAG